MNGKMRSWRRMMLLTLALLMGLLIVCSVDSSDSEGVASMPPRPPTIIEATATATAPRPPATTAAVDKWALWTGDTQLRGTNIYQRRVYPELDGPDFMGPGPVGPPFTQEDLNRLAAMGANYVNVSHPGLFAETAPYTLDPDIQDNLDDLLAMIAQADMFAVISFRGGPGRSEFTFVWDEVGDWFDAGYLNDSIWQDQAAQDAWVDMWHYTAQRYGDNPIVVGYDLMVEPNSNEVGSNAIDDQLDIWDPEAFYGNYGGTLYDWNQLYPRISDAIREVDADTPILIGGMGYSAVEWLPYLRPTGDPRTVYVVHQYRPIQYTHQPWESLDCTYPGRCDLDWDGDDDDRLDRDWLDGLLSTVDAFVAKTGLPVAVNEFGVVRWEPGAADFMDDQMALFEERGLNHALWEWAPSWEPFAENDAFNFRHGLDPDHHADVASSDLMEVIAAYWGRNTIRPSSPLTFTPVATVYLSSVSNNNSITAEPLPLHMYPCACVSNVKNVSRSACQIHIRSQALQRSGGQTCEVTTIPIAFDAGTGFTGSSAWDPLPGCCCAAGPTPAAWSTPASGRRWQTVRGSWATWSRF